MDAVPKSARSDSNDRLENDGDNGGLEAEEQSGDRCGVPDKHVEPGQRHDGERARQNEQCAPRSARLGAMQEPADIDCELLCFRAWKQHAEVERMEETLLPDPLFLVDQDAVHHRDLPGRAAKAQRRDAGKTCEGNLDWKMTPSCSPSTEAAWKQPF
jgi:hypothetical protein